MNNVILGFHAVPAAADGAGFGRALPYLRKVAAFVAKNRVPVDLPDVLGRQEGRVAFTFDDGYQSIYTNALPVLEEFDIPATVFINPGILDGADRRTRLANLRNDDALLSADQIRELIDHPLITIGNHTKTHHPVYAHHDESVLRDEIVGGKKMIEDRFGIAVDRFCYPYNRKNETSAAIARESHTFVLAERYGLVAAGTSPSRLPRISGEQGWRRFRWEMSRFYSLFS